MPLLDVTNLCASVEGKDILQGVTLSVNPGEVHALMGPNGSGKSTLASVLMGHPAYQVTRGSVAFAGADLLAMKAENRSRAGLFLAFQYPVAVPGLSVEEFLRASVNAHRSARQEKPFSIMEFRNIIQAEAAALGLKHELTQRGLNDGFSGGEKKRLEILQLALLKPKLAVLDETDSGLDVDALRAVAEGVNRLLGPDLGVLVITHYQRLLHLLKPTHVHVMAQGKVVRSGGPDLVTEVERDGYASFTAV